MATTRLAPSSSSARVRPPGPGPISMTVPSFERRRGARDAARQVEVEQEVLAEALLRIEAVRRDGLAQRRQGRDAVHAQCPAPARHVVGHVDGREQAGGIGAAGSGDIERRAVIGRGAHERQAERDVDAAGEVDGLDRDQRLVVIHAERDVIG